jgi:hypothetical protein
MKKIVASLVVFALVASTVFAVPSSIMVSIDNQSNIKTETAATNSVGLGFAENDFLII